MTRNEECDIYFAQSKLIGMKTDVRQMTLLNTNTMLYSRLLLKQLLFTSVW